jgi:hypothetical protein
MFLLEVRGEKVGIELLAVGYFNPVSRKTILVGLKGAGCAARCQ